MKFGAILKGAAAVLQNFSKTQLAVLGLTMTITIGGVGAGGYMIYNHFSEPEEVAGAVTDTETESEKILAEVTEGTEGTGETEETEAEISPVKVKLVGTSIEKDLKIKIQDEESTNIKGEEFYISIKPKEGSQKESVFGDDDNDGIIHVQNIEGGEYVVALQEIEGYYTEEESYTFSVKAKIEYTKVEVEDEIKKESEVSPSEDAQKEEIAVENEIKDTVERLDSACTSTKVAASSLNKDQYINSKVTLGDAVAKNLPEGVASAIRKNIFLVGTGSTANTGTQTSESSQDSENSGGGTTPSEGQNPSEGGSGTPEEQLVSYEITHVFSDGKPTEQQSSKGKAGDKIAITQYEGYTSNYTEKEFVLDSVESNNKLTITWTKIAATQAAKVSMPGTANVFISQLSAANTLTLEVTIEDNNQPQMVDKENISWSLKDDTTAGAALSAVKGTKVSLSAKSATKEGSVTVVATIPYTTGGVNKETTLECKVTVKKDSYDATKILTDSTGSILYTDSNCTTTATVGDLLEKEVTTFYKDPKYTGWQTLDGKLYYFNSKNEPVTGQQIISGITYTFGPDGALTKGATSTGIDVSKWQGTIDWPTVKAAGIEFAIIRVGYRGSETGVLVEDPTFKQNIEGATKAGLKVGVYFFTQAITEAEAVEEASMALSLTKNYKLDFPIFVDTENGSGNARANGLDKATRTACVAAFCKTVQNSGRTAGVYASTSWYNNKLNTSQLNNYCIWVAQYNTTCTYQGRYSIWQYTSTGSVPGIKGNVDLNISYM